MWGHLHIRSTELERAKPDRLGPDRELPNQGLHSQIVMCDLCCSEILRSVEWYFITDVLDQPISGILKGQEIQKREKSMTELNLTHSSF
jgi:hypothetical protein